MTLWDEFLEVELKEGFVLDILKHSEKTTLKPQTNCHSLESVHSHIIPHLRSQMQKKKKVSLAVVYICIVLIMNETEPIFKLQF